MTNQQTKEESKPKEEIVYKFSNKGQGQLREAAIIEGKPYFIKYFHNEDKNFIQVEPKIIDVTPVLRPPLGQEYPNNNPYEFKTVDEPQIYLQRALTETPDSILAKIKTHVKRFNDIDDNTVTLLSANILGSYFQDRFSTVHYLIIIGANGTGKSAFGDTYECVGYRAVKVINTTDAFWFRIFGNVEYGQVTIIAEEFDRMDESSQVMTVLKEGYQPNTRVPRMNSNNDKMEFFNPFGFKIIIGEKSPNENKARGVLDRSFKIKSYKGIPDYNIKEIRNPQGNSMRQELFDEMDDLRKLLLMYRLIHIKDPYKEITIGLDGRDEELCKPLLQLFFTLGASYETLRELEETLQYFLDTKNKRKGQTLEAIIYPIIVNIVSEHGERISSSELWRLITESLEGQVDEKNASVFYSSDYGKLYRNTVTGMICDKFGAEIDHRRDGNTILFNSKNLNKVGKIYQTSNINTKSCDSVTHRDDREGQGILSNKEEELRNSNLLDNEPVNHSDHGESPNHADKKKCPYCDYEEDPFFLKVHVRYTHPEQGNNDSV
jgi:hypothetical protein